MWKWRSCSVLLPILPRSHLWYCSKKFPGDPQTVDRTVKLHTRSILTLSTLLTVNGQSETSAGDWQKPYCAYSAGCKTRNKPRSSKPLPSNSHRTERTSSLGSLCSSIENQCRNLFYQANSLTERREWQSAAETDVSKILHQYDCFDSTSGCKL